MMILGSGLLFGPYCGLIGCLSNPNNPANMLLSFWVFSRSRLISNLCIKLHHRTHKLTLIMSIIFILNVCKKLFFFVLYLRAKAQTERIA